MVKKGQLNSKKFSKYSIILEIETSKNISAFIKNILFKTTQLRNPQGNVWRSSTGITFSNGGLNANVNNSNEWLEIYAEKGFPISVADCRKDHFPGTILYYYEVKILTSALW